MERKPMKYYEILDRPSMLKMLGCLLQLGAIATIQAIIHSLYAVFLSAILALVAYTGLVQFSYTEALTYVTAVFVPLNILKNGVRIYFKSEDWGKVYFTTVLFWMAHAGTVTFLIIK